MSRRSWVTSSLARRPEIFCWVFRGRTPPLYLKVVEILTPLLGNDPDNVMTERGRGVIKTWSCWVAEAKGANFPHISQVACIRREVCSITGEKLPKMSRPW
jgi:hypothetical protein